MNKPFLVYGDMWFAAEVDAPGLERAKEIFLSELVSRTEGNIRFNIQNIYAEDRIVLL